MVKMSPSAAPIVESLERNEGCMMCYLWKKDEFQGMELVEDNEISMDQAFRKDVVDSAGFCNSHMHGLYKVVFSGGIPDGLGYAMYVDDTIQMFTEKTSEMQASFGGKKSSLNFLSKERSPQAVVELSPPKLKKMLEGSRICEICRRLLLIDGRRARTFIDMLGHDEDFRDRYSRSGRLCYPHFVTAMQMLQTRRVNKQEVATTLIESELRSIKEVARLLTEGGEGSPEMAAAMIAGVDGLYCVTKKSPNPMAEAPPPRK